MAQTGLRARKRAKTRDQIAQTAIKFFFERGYEETTLEDIAEAAEVHKRTLLRYFPTKAHLILHTQYAAVEKFRETIAARKDESVIDIWQEQVSFYSRDMMRRGRQANVRIFASIEPAVEPAFLAIQAQYQTMISNALSAELGRDPASDIESKIIAAALVGANYSVAAMIFENEAYDDLENSLLKVIQTVREGLLCRITKP